MIVSMLQPGYLPWLGFFEQVYRCDIFVIYDDAQYTKGDWRNRNRIKTAGGAKWLTVPVKKDSQYKPINKVKIDNSTNWGKKHLNLIEYNYHKSLYYKNYIDIFKHAYSLKWKYLAVLDAFFIMGLMISLKINTPLVASSSLNVEGKGTEKLINICKELGADTFYEGAAGRNYINNKDFTDNGIEIIYQDYKHPVYKQQYGDFVSHLSIIDLLFNCGKESLSILLNDEMGKYVYR